MAELLGHTHKQTHSQASGQAGDRTRRLVRRHQAIGGVCSGIAHHFDCDVILVRVTAVVLFIMTCGLITIPYLILWAVLSRPANDDTLIDIEPHPVQDRALGDGLFKDTTLSRPVAGRSYVGDRPSDTDRASVANGSPDGAISDYRKSDEGALRHSEASYKLGSDSRVVKAGSYYFRMLKSLFKGKRPTATEDIHPQHVQSYRVALALFFLICVLFALLAFAVSFVGSTIDPFALSPLILLAFGVMLLVLPDQHDSVVPKICEMIVCFEASALLMLFSTGYFSLDELNQVSNIGAFLWFLTCALIVAAIIFRTSALSIASTIVFALAFIVLLNDLGVFNLDEVLFVITSFNGASSAS